MLANAWEVPEIIDTVQDLHVDILCCFCTEFAVDILEFGSKIFAGFRQPFIC